MSKHIHIKLDETVQRVLKGLGWRYTHPGAMPRPAAEGRSRTPAWAAPSALRVLPGLPETAGPRRRPQMTEERSDTSAELLLKGSKDA